MARVSQDGARIRPGHGASVPRTRTARVRASSRIKLPFSCRFAPTIAAPWREGGFDGPAVRPPPGRRLRRVEAGLRRLRRGAPRYGRDRPRRLHLVRHRGRVERKGRSMQGLMMDDYQLTLTSLVDRAEHLHESRRVVSRAPDGEVHRTTYGAVIERARRLASALGAQGVGPGDRVATLLWNQPEHLELYFAVSGMGAVIHTLNPRLHPDELAFIMDDAKDRVIVVDETLLPVIQGIETPASVERLIVVAQGEPAPSEALDYATLVGGGEPMAWPELQERQAAAMCYTSGTTGRPKGVVYSHRALVLHSFCAALPDALVVGANDTVLPVVPMFHANAWGLPFACAMAGADIVLPGPRLDAVSVLDLLESERVTMTAGVPTVWMAVLSALEGEPRRWDLS